MTTDHILHLSLQVLERDDLYITVTYTYGDNYGNPRRKEYLRIAICYPKSMEMISNLIITQIDLVEAL